MHFLATAIGLVLFTGLAACGGPAEQKAPVNPAETASAFQARLQAMPEGGRNGVFIRAIRDADQDCQHVEMSAPASSPDGTPVWFASCTGGGTFAIAIRDGGIAQVIPERGQLIQSRDMNSTATGNNQ